MSKLAAYETPEQVREKPVYCPGGVRHKGGMTLIQAFVWNMGSCVLMLREKSKWQPHEEESTDAVHSDGVARSSGESS
jgi:hypothetical protein